jgi:hypothetical protein
MDHLKAYLWYLIEVGVSLICTSAATMQPLLVAWNLIDSTHNSGAENPMRGPDDDVPLTRLEEMQKPFALRPIASSTKSMNTDM